ncbi:hypothetical protein HAX54_037142 [Datura stramonium]|uniref:Uncharacterized protein n=1 Tax=Datura stramonium TaxID=4076 RepID=A0ABS8SGZ9_DATST|nr:hypothetical protein [Datura stramonium]
MEALVIPHRRQSSFPPCWPIFRFVTLPKSPILPPWPRLLRVRPTGFSPHSGENPVNITMSEYESLDDLVPLDSLKMVLASDSGALLKNKWSRSPPPLKLRAIAENFRVTHHALLSKERRDAASFLDLMLMELLDQELPINFPN